MGTLMRPLLLVLLLCGVCSGQTIDGPDEVQLMHPQKYAISDIPEGCSTLVLYSDVIDNDPQFFKPNHFLFWSKEPGKFELSAIVINWKSQQVYQIRKVIKVIGEPGPDPPNPPDPPDPPDPLAKWQIWFFRESTDGDELTTDHHELLSGLKFRDSLEEKGHLFMGSWDISSESQANWPVKMVEKDCLVDRFGRKTCFPPIPMRSPPKDLAVEVWDKVRGDPMPRVAIAPIDGGVIQDFPLPDDVSGFWKLLESAR